MAKRIGGARRKTRHKFAKSVRQRGKVQIARYVQAFTEGEKVALVAEPSVQKGMYFARFHGRSGTVMGKRGNCYEVVIDDLGMKKTVIVHPVHLQKEA